jgi:hypothetical protein
MSNIVSQNKSLWSFVGKAGSNQWFQSLGFYFAEFSDNMLFSVGVEVMEFVCDCVFEQSVEEKC